VSRKMRNAKFILAEEALVDPSVCRSLQQALNALPRVVSGEFRCPFQCETYFRYPDQSLGMAEENEHMAQWKTPHREGADGTLFQGDVG